MFIVVLPKTRFFQDMAPYMYQRFGEDCCFHRPDSPFYTASYSWKLVSNNNLLNETFQ